MPPNVDQLLAASRLRALPTAPGNLEDLVWRSIRQREARPGRPGLAEGLFFWLDDARLIGASVMAALVIGIAFNFMWTPAPSTQKVMGLDVFAPGSSSALGRLASQP